MNRRRHLPTVAGCTPTAAATSVLSSPSAQPNTMRERCAREKVDFGRRAHRWSVDRSSSVSISWVFGRPLVHMREAYDIPS
jgi:hypothetical protein